jgi:hypothetical protein
MGEIYIDEDVLRIVFDTAVNSMDFSSGFLDHEEVAALQAAAVVLGVDPMEATPQQFKCEFKKAHTWAHDRVGYPNEWQAREDAATLAAGLELKAQCIHCGRKERRQL